MSDDNGLVHQPSGNGSAIAKQSVIGEQSVTRVVETASQVVAAQARAQIEARYAMAITRPRDWNNVRVKLLAECERPGFAETAWYSKPVGGNAIEGLSIRFAEAAMRHIGNLLPEITVIYDDDKLRIIRVALSDLEANLYLVKDVAIQKTVERRQLKGKAQPISTRINSYGDTVYLVQATDDDLLNKENAQASKALRNHILRLIPGDIIDECREKILATLKNTAAKDPAAESKKIMDAFARLNVMPSDIKAYLGHDIAQATPPELVELRAVYTAVKTGETNWPDSLEQKLGDRAPKDDKPSEGPPKSLSDLKKNAKKAAEPKITVKGADGQVINTDEPKPCEECGKIEHVVGCPMGVSP